MHLKNIPLKQHNLSKRPINLSLCKSFSNVFQLHFKINFVMALSYFFCQKSWILRLNWFYIYHMWVIIGHGSVGLMWVKVVVFLTISRKVTVPIKYHQIKNYLRYSIPHRNCTRCLLLRSKAGHDDSLPVRKLNDNRNSGCSSNLDI